MRLPARLLSSVIRNCKSVSLIVVRRLPLPGWDSACTVGLNLVVRTYGSIYMYVPQSIVVPVVRKERT